MAVTVYISIGNSDDKLTQREWAQFFSNTALLLQGNARVVHGQWASEPASAWQNACWCVGFDTTEAVATVRAGLRRLAEQYKQESIAWAVCADTEFLTP